MRVLIAVGSDLSVNSSANLCHKAYIQGFLENGCMVDLLTVGMNTSVDSLGFPKEARLKVYGYPMESLYEKLGKVLRKKGAGNAAASNAVAAPAQNGGTGLPHRIKRWIHSLYGPYEVYIAWKKKAVCFESAESYDLAVSLSFPPVSHLLVEDLIKKKHIVVKKWVQLWEDPWCQDLVFRSLNDEKRIVRARREEARLLDTPDEVLYVSPITLEHQKAEFPKDAGRMRWLPVPTYYQNDAASWMQTESVFGYFGDYGTQIRNLEPFYLAAKQLGVAVNICGASDKMFASTERITVKPRVSLEELRPIENRTNILVFLCNLRGGQIPGKIYQYSATRKPILFILDGTEEEQEILVNFFDQFHRYEFCRNTVESISEAMRKMMTGNIVELVPVDCFGPGVITKKIMENGGLPV